MVGLFSAFAESFYQLNVTLYKTDAFIYGKLFGKILKIAIQFKLIHYTGNYNFLYDAPANFDLWLGIFLTMT